MSSKVDAGNRVGAMVLPREPFASPAQDVDALQAEGMEHIRRLCGETWTDHNVHDPGRTSLTMLCYALSDLAHRAERDLADLLAPEPDRRVPPPYFSARETLTCAPVTREDLRRLVIDVEGVRNAWIERVEAPEPPEPSKPLFVYGRHRVLVELDSDVGKEEKIAKVRAVLHANRPLCEDFEPIERIEPVVRIGVCARIEVGPDVDVDELHAKVGLALQEVFSPTPEYLELDELLAGGVDPADIFDGPRLQGGFVTRALLDRPMVRDEIHASTLIDALHELGEAVVAVRNFRMVCRAQTDKGETRTEAAWSLSLKQPARFDHERSCIVYERRGIPLTPDSKRVKVELGLLEAARARPRLPPHPEDIAAPTGRWQDAGDYRSIQREFPRNYGIGEAGLPPSAPAERLAQARQFKAYLALFDQLMADYLGQLARVGETLGVHEDPDRCMRSAPTHDAPDLLCLLQKFVNEHGASESSRLSVEAEAKLRESYAKTLRDLLEDEDTGHERRIAILDHLLARHGEDMRDYDQLVYAFDRSVPKARLVRDRAAFLRHWPETSYRRGLGMDQLRPEDIEKGANRAGLEARVSDMLGIPRVQRWRLAPRTKGGEPMSWQHERFDARTIAQRRGKQISESPWMVERTFRHDPPNGSPLQVWQYELFMPDAVGGEGIRMLASPGEGVSRPHDDPHPRHEWREALLNEASASWIAGGGGFDDTGAPLGFLSVGPAGELGRSPEPVTQKEGLETLARLREWLDGSGDDNEGFHVVEHILLRPLDRDDPRLPTPEDPQCEACEDPYSFQITVILPAWPQRFRSHQFRAHVEERLRLEAPAHVALKLCWVSVDAMRDFENAWLPFCEQRKRWLCDELSQPDYTEALGAVVDVLGKLRSMHLIGTLYGPENEHSTAERKNPIVLDHTHLGELHPDVEWGKK